MQIPQLIKDIPPFVSAGVALLALGVSVVHAIINWRNYRRDQSKLRVVLRWNAEQTQFEGARSPVECYGHITVTNVGRRPVTVNFIALHLPGRKRVTNWLDEPIRLQEGEEVIKKVHQDATLTPFLGKWDHITASATDSTDKTYVSKNGGEVPIIAPTFQEETARRLKEIE